MNAALVERWIASTFFAVALMIGAVAALLAATLPYHGWDPYAFGDWSRLIELRGGFPQTGPSVLHRPLFYVLQGEAWRLFGYHMAIGRFLSLGFTLVLVAAVAWLAAGPTRRMLRASVALVVVLIVPDIAGSASNGLTDIPAAAMVALAAVVLWTVPDGRVRPVLLVAAGLLAVLAKPSGIVGILALLLAQLLGSRTTLRHRLKRDVLPLALGLAAGLAYDWAAAVHEHMGLRPFLQSGLGGLWAERAAAARGEALFGWHWLGGPLHVVLVFAVIYALLRAGGAGHRPAATAAVPTAWVWAWLAPSLAGHSLRPDVDGASLATYVVAAALAFVIAAPENEAPTRVEAARLLVWAAPAAAFWVYYAAYDTRLVSAAWPPLILLMSSVLTMTIVGAGQRAPLLAAVPAATLVWFAVNNVNNLDGLGRDGWRQYRAAGISGLGDARLMENIALGQFQEELDSIRELTGPDDRILGGDGRLDFFFPGRVVNTYPTSCKALTGYRLFVLLTSDESVAQARAAGAPATESEWSACQVPRLTAAASADTFVLFVIG